MGLVIYLTNFEKEVSKEIAQHMDLPYLKRLSTKDAG